MALAEIEQLLRRSMGLDAASVGISAIERAVQQRIKTSGLLTWDAYWEYLQGSTFELQELIETVVVPETWFFRDEEAFATLVRLVTEEWPRGRATDVVRILSVPCSTGEEPYSIVMALRDGGLASRQIVVDAVDISARVLAHAQRGLYGRNSFRNQNLAFRERHFSAVGESHELAGDISQSVKFHQGNLVSGQFPFPVILYDVIYCRNLLIYFDRSTQEKAMQTLHSLLAPEGVLFVGHAEAFLASSSGFTSVHGPGSFAFRKSPAGRRETAASTPPRLRAPIQKQPRPAPPIVTRPPASPVATPETSLAGLAAAQRLADEGQLQEAAECCERHVAQKGPSAEAYYLLGVIRDAAGERDRAAESYRRAVYLDPNHVESLTHLALLAEAQQDTAAARRFRERAQRSGESSDVQKVV